jgi:hypothetical protein
MACALFVFHGPPEALPLLDPRRLPPVVTESLRSDTAGAWREHDHGPMLRVCDLARAAIARLPRP